MSELNDPRVFFAAERTLLAWNRTSLALMAFGFVIERSGLLVSLLLPQHTTTLQRGMSLWVGIAFVLLGAGTAVYSTVQYRKVILSLKPVEIPDGYRSDPGIITNLIVALLGALLAGYFFLNA